jgi:Ethanolamine utilization protein EutJ (predicted chaperonin)
MAQVFRSGAFVQQCFAVHPLCVTLKRFEDRNKLVFTCSSCRMAHHVSVNHVVARVSIVMDAPDDPVQPARDDPAAVLDRCIVEHAGAVTIRELDVLQDSMGLRCGQCRRVFDLRIASCESRQK